MIMMDNPLVKERVYTFTFSVLSYQRNSVVPAGNGWSGGAMMLGKLPVPGRPAYLDNSRI